VNALRVGSVSGVLCKTDQPENASSIRTSLTTCGQEADFANSPSVTPHARRSPLLGIFQVNVDRDCGKLGLLDKVLEYKLFGKIVVLLPILSFLSGKRPIFSNSALKIALTLTVPANLSH
jgi:hypothetical protein